MEHAPPLTKPPLIDQNLDELQNRLVLQQSWTKFQQRRVEMAYGAAQKLFEGKMHRDEPYVKHLARVALRLVDDDYLGLHHPTWAIAGLHHDTLEDFPGELINLYNERTSNGFFKKGSAEHQSELAIPDDPFERQRVALKCVRFAYGDGVAHVIAGVTNPPGVFDGVTDEQKLDMTGPLVARAITSRYRFPVKFGDCIDHDDGLVLAGTPAEARLGYYGRKNYETLIPLAQRFNEPDVQDLFSDQAKQYIRKQFDTRLAQVRAA